jgi:hypothetical protein
MTCFFRSFGLTQKNEKVKPQQRSSRTGPDAGPLLRRPTAPFQYCFLLGMKAPRPFYPEHRISTYFDKLNTSAQGKVSNLEY